MHEVRRIYSALNKRLSMSNSMKYGRNLTFISLKLFFIIAIFNLGNSALAADEEVCWKHSDGRYVGTIPNVCPTGWSPSLVGTCNNDCPAGYRDDGLFCRRAEYGRGVGYGARWPAEWTLTGAKERCAKDNGALGCEQCGAIIYPKCKAGYKAVGCNICADDLSCPPGFESSLGSCRKATKLATCPSGKVYDAGLCYAPCGSNQTGIGPVCWTNCPKGMVDCGALCGKSVMACLTSVGDMIYSIADVGLKVAKAIATLGASLGSDAAAQAARAAMVESLKATAKEVAKNIVKKLGTTAIGPIKAAVAAELLKMGVPEILRNKLAEMAADPENFDYLAFMASVDVSGLTNIVVAFKKPICSK
jgi:hypothetical protein